MPLKRHFKSISKSLHIGVINSTSSCSRWFAWRWFGTSVRLTNNFKMSNCFARGNAKMDQFHLRAHLKPQHFWASICSTRSLTWDSYFARNAWEHSRGSRGPEYHTLGFLTHYLSKLHLIPHQTRICNLLYCFKNYFFSVFIEHLISLYEPASA